MSALSYLLELAAPLGLEVVPGLHPFQLSMKESKCHGTICGMRRNHIVAVSKLTAPNNKLLGIMIRWPKLGENSMVKSAITSMPEFGGFVGSRKASVADDGVVITWTYALRAPKPAEVVAVIDSVLTTISSLVSPFKGICEDCGRVEQKTLTAQSGIPAFHCSNCQLKIEGDQEQKSREYQETSPELMKALMYTVLAAAGWAAVQTAVLYFLTDSEGTPVKLWVVLSILTGVIVGQVFAKSVGKIEVWPQAAYLFVIAIAANIAADVAFMTFNVARYFTIANQHVEPSMGLALSILKTWHRYRFHLGVQTFITFGEIAGAFIPIEVLYKARPKFKPVFQFAGNVTCTNAVGATSTQ